MGNKSPFVHLHLYSFYSIGESLCSVENLCNRVAELGMPAVAITDKNSLASVPDFVPLAQRYGIKPIVGLEKNVIPFSEKLKNIECSLILLSTNEKGYSNLVKLLNYSLPNVDFINNCKEGIIALSDGTTGEIVKLLKLGEKKSAYEVACIFQELFGKNNFYLEFPLSTFTTNSHLAGELLELSKITEIPIVITNPVRYLLKEDARVFYYFKKFLGSQNEDSKVSLNTATAELVESESYLKDYNEICSALAAFSLPSKLLNNSLNIAERCQIISNYRPSKSPYFEPPKGYDSDSYLWSLLQQGLRERYSKITSTIRNRLSEEFNLLRKKNWFEYMLIIYDLTHYLRTQNILINLDRSPLGYSLIAYLLKITNIDVIKYELPADFFYQEETVLPVIEIEYSKKEKILPYLRNRYGNERVCSPAYYITSVLTFDKKEVKVIVSSKPDENTIIISREHIDSQFPIFKDPKKENYYLQFAVRQIKNWPLVILKLRKNNILLALEDILKLINIRHEKKIQLQTIPYSTSYIYKTIRKGETIAVPYLESLSIRSLCRQLKPMDFSTLEIALLLHRCGYPSAEIINRYLSAKTEKEKEEISNFLFSFYVERILELIKKTTNFKESESYSFLAKLIESTSTQRTLLEELKSIYIRSSTRAGFKTHQAEQLLASIIEATKHKVSKLEILYLCKLASQCLYLKINYPSEYMFGMLRIRGKSIRKRNNYINEARRLGIKILPPDVNVSFASLSLENNHIRLGLTDVKGIGNKVALNIISEREKAPYSSLYNFCKRIDPQIVTRKTIETLIYAGAFSTCCPNLSKAQLLAILDETLRKARSFSEKTGELTLFDLSLYSVPEEAEEDKAPLLEEFSLEKILDLEKKSTGVFITAPPLTPYEEFVSKFLPDRVCIKDIVLFVQNEKKVKVAGIIVEKQITTRNGKTAWNIYVEDDTGILKLPLSSQISIEYSDLINEGNSVLVFLRLRPGEYRTNILVDKIFSLKEISNPLSGILEISLSRELSKYEAKSLYHFLSQYKGNNQIRLIINGLLRFDGYYGRIQKIKIMLNKWLLYTLEEKLKPCTIKIIEEDKFLF